MHLYRYVFFWAVRTRVGLGMYRVYTHFAHWSGSFLKSKPFFPTLVRILIYYYCAAQPRASTGTPAGQCGGAAVGRAAHERVGGRGPSDGGRGSHTP